MPDHMPQTGSRDLAVYVCCDQCGALARHRVTLTNQLDLLFCDHHYRDHTKALRATQPGAITTNIGTAA